MVIRLESDLENVLNEQAQRAGVSAEDLAVNALRQRFMPASPIQPQDEWERELLGIGTDCGVSPSNESLSREQLYD